MWKEIKDRLCRMSAHVVGDQKGILSDTTLAADLSVQAQQHYQDGQTDKAVALMERAVQILTRSVGDQHPETVKASETLGRFTKAFKAANESLTLG